MDTTKELQVGREYELRIEGHTSRKITYLGLKQKNYQKSPKAIFIEDCPYADGKPAVWSVEISTEHLAIKDFVLTVPVRALSSGLLGHLNEIRANMRENKWEEILAAA